MVLGISAQAVLANGTELEGTPGVSVLLARLPGIGLSPFIADDLAPVEDTPEGIWRLRGVMGIEAEHRATLFFADPFSVPMVKLLPAMSRAGGVGGPLFGGMASAGRQPGGNAFFLNDRVMRTGGVGVSMRGPLRVDGLVSQGCRAFGPPFVITKARNNLIFELGGRPAIEAIQEAVEDLGEEKKMLLAGGLFIGRVINEYKERFGRDDFLIRGVVGVAPEQGAIAVQDHMRTGQTIRLHVRDARTAHEDLAMLLDAQKLRERPAGALLITCNGRGERLFRAKHHDARAIARAFAPTLGGEQLSRGGEGLDPALNNALPVAGFFAAGEIGPVGGESHLHGHTACIALFRRQDEPASDR